MRNILILSNFIPPEHSATGRIAYSIAKELAKSHNVYLICLSNNETTPDSGDLKVNKVLNRYGKYKKLVGKANQSKGLIKIFYKISYKLYYKYAQRKGLEDVKSNLQAFKKRAKQCIVDNNIDTIISFSNPFEIQEVGQYLKKKYCHIKWYPYLMDSNRHNISYAIETASERGILEKAKKVLIVPALLFDKDFCKDFEDKIEVVDLPIIPTDSVIRPAKSGARIKLIFAGMFYKDVRDPKFLLEFMTRLPDNYSLELYYGGCSDIVKTYQEILGDRLSTNGFISPQDLEEKMSNAHVVINIGNTVLNQVSSKAYDLISTGKPILNFYQNEQDISLEHLRHYSLCYHMDYRNITEEDIQGLIKWVKEVEDEKVDYMEATKDLKEKRLSNVAERIVEIIQ